MKKSVLYLLLLPVALGLYSFTTQTAVQKEAVIELFDDAFPAKGKNAKIDLYVTQQPTKSYTAYARIVSRTKEYQFNLKQIQKAARTIGADGLLITTKTPSGTVVSNGSPATATISDYYGMTAIAIKYK
jgi:hypothetical protein